MGGEVLKVQLEDVLAASQHLSEMADVYDGIIGKFKSAGSSTTAFESGSASGPYGAAINKLWTISANTSDNLDASARTLIRYINAVCATDAAAAAELKRDRDAFNASLAEQERDSGGDLGNELPEVKPGDPDGTTVDEPTDTPADRPGGN
ncbi:hypothetical protein Afil01_43560 [Actinorhabdospora filicis]|uniref:Uncharacterized protein n=1 Tax=Actinorhabdospora filicis TaxID=1785913 RepID=A0A9W6WAD5_9ACTN|nr:hypothetical protein [Actinorhabdospora filicis]GLZ79549.1 hypothetical protein Afil01_43560 [Actinorhabdospora filicis]